MMGIAGVALGFGSKAGKKKYTLKHCLCFVHTSHDQDSCSWKKNKKKGTASPACLSFCPRTSNIAESFGVTSV